MKRSFLSIAAVILCIIFCSAAVYGFHGRARTGGTVTGQIIIKGQGPMMGGTVFFVDEAEGIPPSATGYWLAPTRTFRVDENSMFTAELPDGTYYIGAVERGAGQLLGPPDVGDNFFLIRDGKGNPKKLTVWKKATIDLGTLDEASPFKGFAQPKKGTTVISGRIHDVHGAPVPGMIVVAYPDPEMSGNPLFVSERSGMDGGYLLRLFRGGTYYLMARANADGGPVTPEEFMGIYKEGTPVKVKTGSMRRGIDIAVWPAGYFD